MNAINGLKNAVGFISDKRNMLTNAMQTNVGNDPYQMMIKAHDVDDAKGKVNLFSSSSDKVYAKQLGKETKNKNLTTVRKGLQRVNNFGNFIGGFTEPLFKPGASLLTQMFSPYPSDTKTFENNLAMSESKANKMAHNAAYKLASLSSGMEQAVTVVSPLTDYDLGR